MIDYAKCCFVNGAYRECLLICEDILRANAFNPQAIELAAISSLKLRDVRCFDYCLRAYQGNPNSFFLAYNLAMAAKETGRLQDAQNILENLAKRDNNVLKWQCLRELASLYKRLGLLADSYKIYVALLQQTPKDLTLWNEVSELFMQNNLPAALQTCIESHNKLLEIIEQLQKQPVAQNVENQNVPEYQKPLQSRLDQSTNAPQENPEVVAIRNFLNSNLDLKIAKLYFDTRQDEEALKFYESLQIPNRNNAEFWRDFAYALECQGRYEDAKQAYSNAININPHPTYKFDLAYLLMRLGNFTEGVEFYENRLYYASLSTFAPDLYRTAMEAFKKDENCFKDKVICVYCEQGFGDTLMYCRLLEEVCKSATEVLFLPQSMLFPLFKNWLKKLKASKDSPFKNLKVLNTLPKEFDYALPICSLPYFYKVDSLERINALKSPIVPITRTEKKKEKKVVGFFWFSQFGVNRKLKKNFPLELFLEAFEGLDYKFVSLQVGDYELPEHIENRGKNFQNWLDTYEALEDIDYVVGIDSSPLHLCMSVGIPCLAVLDSRFDWRFGLYEAPTPLFYENFKDNVKLIVSKDIEQTKEEIKLALKKI